MRAREVAAALGGACREGHDFRCRCPVHKGRNLTLSDGRNALLVKCWGGCDASDVLAELRRLQLTGEICRTGDTAFERPDDCRDRERRIGIARHIWEGAKDARGTPVERYLAGRGITIPLPPSLRWASSLRRPDGTTGPAMVARVDSLDGELIGVQRTWLDRGASDGWRRRDRASLGPVGGGAVRLARHRPGLELLVGEGIETILAAMQLFHLPGWAAICASGIAALPLPDEVRTVIIAADNDENLVGQRAALLARERWAGEGRSVRILGPPNAGEDFNDVLLSDKIMTNGLGTDPSSYEVDPEKLADEIARKKRRNGAGDGGEEPPQGANGTWLEPDMGVLRLHRRPPPGLPIEVFGPAWAGWASTAAEAAACPVDYVAAPLLASASALIGHARWAQAAPGWAEPPHLWIGAAGDSGNGKSPGADCLMRDVLPEIERRMVADFPDRLREWRASIEFGKATEEGWQKDVREAQKRGAAAPLPPVATAGPEPQSPRLRQNDVTIERVATLLATAAPKGLLIVRDELAGWIDGMAAYNPAGRGFWVEAYGGRPYRVERQKHPEPIVIPRLAVSVYGTTQPDRLALLMRGADDGLLARILWTWPEPIPFRLGRTAPGAQWAIGALDRLRELDMQPGDPPSPIIVPLADDARAMIEAFAGEMQQRQAEAGGLLRSAIGKARGQALRLALLIEMLWWCGADGMAPPPARITARAFAAAALLVSDYFLPMAERVYGDAAATERERVAATLARWIIAERPAELHVRHLQRNVRLLGLRTAEQIRVAADALVEADWVRPPTPGTEFGQRGRFAYTVSPRVWEAAP
jgi:hypothetical protein